MTNQEPLQFQKPYGYERRDFADEMSSDGEYAFPCIINRTTGRKRALSVDGATEPHQAKRSANGLSDELCLDETPSTVAAPDSMSSILQPSDDNHTSFQYEDDLRDVDQQLQVSSTSMTNAATTTDHSVLEANVVCSDSAADDLKDNSESRMADQAVLYKELASIPEFDPNKIDIMTKFVQEVATAWGQPLKINYRSIHQNEGPDQVEVKYGFGNIPYFVFGVPGRGSVVESAHASAASNMLKLLKNYGYLPEESIQLLLSQWSDATEQMAEIVQVLRELDRFLDMDKYSSLRTITQFKLSRKELALLQLLRKSFRDRITVEVKSKFLQDIADAYGKPLKISHRTIQHNQEPDQIEVTYTFGDIPEIVLPVKGMASRFESAVIHAVGQFLIILEGGFLSKESIVLLRSEWSNAHAQIAEIVRVLQKFDSFLNTDEYASLRLVDGLLHTHKERVLAGSMRRCIRNQIGAVVAHNTINILSTDVTKDESVVNRSDEKYQSSNQHENTLDVADTEHHVSGPRLRSRRARRSKRRQAEFTDDPIELVESSSSIPIVVTSDQPAKDDIECSGANTVDVPSQDKTMKSRFVQDVATAWGQQLKIFHGHTKAGHFEVKYILGDIPFVVLGVKGRAHCLEKAHGDAGLNLLCALECFLPKESFQLLRSQWSNARDQIAQIVQILREMDQFLNMDKYSSLRKIDRFEFSPYEKALARTLKKSFREHIFADLDGVISQSPTVDMKSKFLQDVATAWGKPLKIVPIQSNNVHYTDGQVWLSYIFGDIPSVVLALTACQSSLETADASAAGQFLIFMQNGYLSKKSNVQLRRRWSNATEQMAELIRVLQMFEDFLNMDEYSPLRMVDGFQYTSKHKELAATMRRSIREHIAVGAYTYITANTISSDVGDYEHMPNMPTLADDNYHSSRDYNMNDADDQHQLSCSSITYTARTSEQSALGEMVRSVVAASHIVDFDAGRLNDRHELTQKNAFGGHATLSEWCQSNNFPLDYERVLLGVEYCGSPSLNETVQEYLLEYEDQCRRVDNEIWNHFHVNAQNSEVYALKMQAREMLLHHFKSAFPYSDIKMYAVGSTMNGCGSFNSDMDLCLCVPDFGTMDTYTVHRGRANDIMFKLKHMMSTKLQHLVKKAIVIGSARVPIVQVVLHAPFENLELDININNIAGIYNSHLIHYYSGLDARFPCLSLLVKHWAINAKINNAQAGTFNSYSLVLLVVHYLQCGVQPAVLPNLQYLFPEKFAEMPPVGQLELHKTIEGLPLRPVNTATCVELLIGFFKYYSNFDFGEYFISIRDARKAPRSDLSIPTKYMIYIEEPFDRNNTARCVIKQNNLDLIKQAFHSARRAFSDGPPDLGRIGVQVVNV